MPLQAPSPSPAAVPLSIGQTRDLDLTAARRGSYALTVTADPSSVGLITPVVVPLIVRAADAR